MATTFLLSLSLEKVVLNARWVDFQNVQCILLVLFFTILFLTCKISRDFDKFTALNYFAFHLD